MSRYGATLLRIALGVIFAMNGYFFLYVLEPTGAAQFINIPGLLGEALAWYLIVTHIVGGLMLMVGLKTRWAALANIPVILIALFQVHVYYGLLMTCTIVDAVGGKAHHPVGLEYPLLVLAATAALALQGGGALAMTDDQ